MEHLAQIFSKHSILIDFEVLNKFKDINKHSFAIRICKL